MTDERQTLSSDGSYRVGNEVHTESTFRNKGVVLCGLTFEILQYQVRVDRTNGHIGVVERVIKYQT